MRKVSAIILYIVAGFFVYAAGLLAFVDQPPASKWGMIAVFSLPALVCLCAGLAINRFNRWKRDVGVVLLSGAGLTAFIALTFVCFLLTEEFKEMIQPESLRFFSAYVSGVLFILGTTALGVIFLKAKT